MRHSTIQFGKNTVTKTSAPRLMGIEVEKTLRANEIGKKCGLFKVPEVLDYDKVKGIAVFERINEIDPIKNFLNKTKNYNSIVEQVGYALAVIHRELILPNDMTIELPQEFMLPGTEVYIHGDYNGINICVVPCTPSIVILDWQMTSRHGGEATYGSRYFDLVWFINYLLWTPTFKYLFHDPVIKVAKLFLQSYFKGIESTYDAEIFVRYCENFFETKMPDRKFHTSIQKRYLIPRSNALTKKFINSVR